MKKLYVQKLHFIGIFFLSFFLFCSQWLLAADDVSSDAAARGLIAAARRGDLVSLQEFLAKGADPNQIVKDEKDNEDKKTALMGAAENGHVECVRALLEKGADPNLTIKGTYWIALVLAAERGRVACVEELLKGGADPNMPGGYGALALLRAAAYGKIECLRFLLDYGVDPNQKDIHGQTAFIWAVRQEYIECAKLLLERGADPNHVENSGKTALGHAVSPCRGGRQSEIIKILLEHEADVNKQDNIGAAPLMYAVYGCNKEYIDMFLKHGADFNQHDRCKRTAATWAMDGFNKCRDECKKLVEQARDQEVFIDYPSDDSYGKPVIVSNACRERSVGLGLPPPVLHLPLSEDVKKQNDSQDESEQEKFTRAINRRYKCEDDLKHIHKQLRGRGFMVHYDPSIDGLSHPVIYDYYGVKNLRKNEIKIEL